MSWRIRMNVVSSIRHLNHSWNKPRIQFNLIDSMSQQRKMTYQCANMKRSLSKEITSSITVEKKKHKSSTESPSFVLVCGQNICGQLGLSTNIIERRKPQYLKIVNNFNIDENIQSIYAGGMHSCALTITGHVYTWGCNDDGALGRITDDIDDEYMPGLFVLPEEIKSICAGDTFTVALAKSGRAYISGCFRSSEGILGLFEYKQIVQKPIMIQLNQTIKQIACGADFCLLLTENGDLYSFGNNEIGQLGRDAHLEIKDNFSIWLRPCQILSFQEQNILNIWAGGHGFFALTQNSAIHLYACGANSFGQLGHPSKQPIYSPVEIQGFPCLNKIIKISCGLQHTLILDSMGYVYGVGRSDDGRLGNNLVNDIIIPKQINNLTNIFDIAAGGSVSFVINQNAQIYSFGMGDTCQIGHSNEDIFIPTLVKSKQLERRNIQHISVGAQHTLFLVKEER
ncbi:unnamed protein product [Rotaria magnacalcarata]|uniref:RCC1-like domain-containing protein n=2 Tax=Rotaria magnacalcarata TaxID=392030 RepID=A0A815AJJ9_9BILA|nr:unnamed protein product [Rotaria magnacalcarata]CAF1258314.1 unnamed protein product [Rotaria magnacalcarata]CAF4134041.1 unnamed protein product [Rotaria magnacalcarata]